MWGKRIIKVNSLLKVQPECISFVGSTRLQAKKLIDNYQIIAYRDHPVVIPFKCEHFPSNIHISDLKALKCNKLQVEDLNIAKHK